MKAGDREKLWDKYKVNPSPELREQLILEYAPLVKIVAGRLCMYLGNTVEYEDLCSYGIFGLIDAIDKFDLAKDVKFETYASLRIRGSILDQIRKMDWIPRTIRQRQRMIDDAIKTVEARTGHSASDEEIASELNISSDEFLKWQSQLNVTNVVSLNEFVEAGNEPNISKQELSAKLKDALDQLTEKEKQVVLLYYYEDMTLKEISAALEVSESRVSQLHTKALQKMRGSLGEYMGILTQ